MIHSEREHLANENCNFKAAIKQTGLSVMMKMHHLVHDTQEIVLDAYSTVSNFAEDALELIHALVNRHNQCFAQMDED